MVAAVVGAVADDLAAVIAAGDPAEIRRSPALVAAYLGEPVAADDGVGPVA